MPLPRPITRREFLYTTWLSLLALSFRPLAQILPSWQPEEPPYPRLLGRVTRREVAVYTQPDLDSPRSARLYRDELVPLLEKVTSPYGPDYNPSWYRVDQGYLHSAYMQRVEGAHLNIPLTTVPESGLLGEVTVPYTQTLYQNRHGYWVKLYRLYYGSIHWITGLEESASGEFRYRLTDEWLRVHYQVPAEHIRPVQPSELAPISPEMPLREKRLEVSLDRQTLTAYEGQDFVKQVKVSTGKRYMTTPTGKFQVNRKYPSKHMGDGGLTSDIRAYELVGVPWVSFFHEAGIAFHGTYWHDNFGYPMSHGCVNMRNEDALWLFRWTTPSYAIQVGNRPTWKITGKGGTAVIVK